MFPLALGESRTKRDQEPRRDKLVFRYWSLGFSMVYIEKMHKASAKLKLKFLFNKFVYNVGVVKKLR